MSTLLAIGLVSVTAVPASAAACGNAGAFAAGDGTTTPYEIATAGQLQYLATAIDSSSGGGLGSSGMSGSKIVLTANIDLAGCAFSPNSPGIPFEGELDGQGFSISNLSVSKPSTSNAGLFSSTSGAEIRNLVLDSPTISALSNTGALVGRGEGTDLENISVVDAQITGSSSVGGIVGDLTNQTGQTMENLRVSRSTVSGVSSVGGVIGLLTWGDLSKVSFSDGRVVGTSGSSPVHIGGLVGFFGSAIYPSRVSRGVSLSSFTGTVEVTHGSTSYAGLLLGNVRNTAATITDSFVRGAIKTGSGTAASGVAGILDSSEHGSTLTLNRVYVQGSYHTLADPTVAVNASAFATSVASTTDSFYDSSIHTMWSSTAGGTGKTSAELVDTLTYPVAWTITQDTDAMRGVSTPSETWFVNDQINSGYPVHVWAYRAGVHAVECSPGSYSEDGYAPCTAAPAGKFVAAYKATTATDCPAGTFSASQQSIACTQAAAGTFVAVAGQVAAISCQVGRYQPLEGQIACLDADPGKFVDITGSNTQTLCPAGKYQPNSGSYACLIADPGFFVEVAGSIAQTACSAGYLSDAGAIACFQQNSSYSGPLVLLAGPLSVTEGQTVSFTGERLSTVTAVEVQGLVAEANLVGNSIQFVLPAGLTAGSSDLVVISSFGRLTVQGALNISTSNRLGVASWTKNLNDGTVKMYAKNIVGAGKVQFMLNGEEIAWVRAVDETDSKLREANGSYYLVRTVDLVEGQKNVLEIYVDGVRTTRTAYTY